MLVYKAFTPNSVTYQPPVLVLTSTGGSIGILARGSTGWAIAISSSSVSRFELDRKRELDVVTVSARCKAV